MVLPEDELIDEYLLGGIIDPCEYDEFALEKLHEFLGDESEQSC